MILDYSIFEICIIFFSHPRFVVVLVLLSIEQSIFMNTSTSSLAELTQIVIFVAKSTDLSEVTRERYTR
jgi:hypothetical protein